MGTWLLTDIIFFSIANFFHEYYMSMVAGPLVALVGIGAVDCGAAPRLPWLASSRGCGGRKYAFVAIELQKLTENNLVATNCPRSGAIGAAC